MHFGTLLPLFLALFTLSSAASPKKPKNAILLSSVKSLTLHANRQTSHRRVSAVPQLTCAGPGCKHHTVETMRCTNSGTGYGDEDIQWTCVADLPEDFKLGGTEVVCEGYSGPDDEFVLKGSCGVNYRLLLTDKGEEKFGGGWFGKGGKKGGVKDNVEGKVFGGREDGDEGLGLSGYLFLALFIGVLVLILYKMGEGVNNQAGARRPRNGGGFGGFGGGGGGDGGDDPPPPYPGYGKQPGSGTGQQGWRPGFWSGAMGGAAAGYMAGNRGGRQEAREVPRSNGWFGGNSGSNLGGRSGSGWGNASPPRPSSSSSNSGSGSSARYSSTGFGGTTRR